MKDKIAREEIIKLNGRIGNLIGNIRKIEKTIEEHNNQLSQKPVSPLKDYVECETCGCLVRIDKAKKVQELVDNCDTLNYDLLYLGMNALAGKPVDQEADKIIKKYYLCKHCKKQNETKKRKK